MALWFCYKIRDSIQRVTCMTLRVLHGEYIHFSVCWGEGACLCVGVGAYAPLHLYVCGGQRLTLDLVSQASSSLFFFFFFR